MIISFGRRGRTEQESLLSALGLALFSTPIISVVGAGGKTTVMERLAREYVKLGQPVIITTTTHMHMPKSGAYLANPDMFELDAMLRKEKAVYMGYPAKDGKISGFPMPFLEASRMLKVPVLIEADGANGHPVKVPDEKEPVLWGKTMVLIGVVGLDAVGRTIEEGCHRPKLAGMLLGKTMQEVVTAADIVKIGLSRSGMKKGMDSYMRYFIILNKADNEERIKLGAETAALFADQGFQNVLLTTGLGEGHEGIN